ncbi:LacI family DNA-binding transcriptional regulator [Shinella sp. BYT-45]|uniref:LacI family DNA-binding transcriptional regulator n=1 Tax=Shinella sp. BYT-45 TaxID=3377377 RepID=UPI00397EF617
MKDGFLRKRATLADVAALAGVSQSTVSLVLNSVADARIGKATRAKVQKAAEALNYRSMARTPQAGPSRLIGVIMDEFHPNRFAAAFLDELRDAAWEEKCSLLVVSTRGQADLEEPAIATLLQQNPVGIVYASLFPKRVTVPDAVAAANAVLVNCQDTRDRLPSVRPDFVDAVVSPFEFLTARGHRRIALLNHEHWNLFAQDRMAGYRKALEDAGIPFVRSYVRHLNGAPDDGYMATLELLKLKEPPTAIICGNDRMAFGAYDAVREMGLLVGGDVSIFGYDDYDIARYCHPPMTTVRMPYSEMARWAVDRLTETGGTVDNTLIAGTIVERGSVGLLRQEP